MFRLRRLWRAAAVLVWPLLAGFQPVRCQEAAAMPQARPLPAASVSQPGMIAPPIQSAVPNLAQATSNDALLRTNAQSKKVKGAKVPPPSALDLMILEAERARVERPPVANGSIYSQTAFFNDAFRDMKASRHGDVVTIAVVDKVTASSKGTATSARKSSATGGITSMLGHTVPPLANLATMSGNRTLDGQGATGRESSLSVTLSARVTHVLPEGTMVVEGEKEITVNSERQMIRIRGAIRPLDIANDNTIRSDRIANLEIRINGKGVVADAVRRPNILYRILNGILPF